MWQYIVKRLLLMLPTLIGAALVVFLLMHVVPGDVALLILGGDQGGDINPQELVKLRTQLGLNRPLYVQFLSWLWGAVHLNFGISLWTGTSVIEEIMIPLPLSLEVAIAATIVSIIIAIPLGTVAAIRQDTWVDYVVRVVSIGGLAIPAFWTGILIILFLVIYFEWGPPLEYASMFQDPWENLKQLIWPIVSVGYRNAAVAARMTRSTVLETMREDYIRTARAKGFGERTVVVKHAFRNACIPVITVLGLQFGQLLGGAIVTETVFAWPGVATLTVDSIRNQDFPVVQCAVILLALVIVSLNLIVDLAVAFIDPRIRTGS